jgi:pimeloyl-ACP methyl ester carboxylesterase
MDLSEIYHSALNAQEFLIWQNGTFEVAQKAQDRENNRETLARVYASCLTLSKVENRNEASSLVRAIWNEMLLYEHHKALPHIICKDGFLRLFALGSPLPIALFRRIWEKVLQGEVTKSDLAPIQIEWNREAERYYDVDATPPNLRSKLFMRWRVKEDRRLMQHVTADLTLVAQIEEPERRLFLTLAVLSHAVAYRELNDWRLYLPNVQKKGELVPYFCEQHLIAYGLKTVSLVPSLPNLPGIYLCQGTELWPSQPSVLGSVLSNFAHHGAATDAYAHSWRRIHLHLRQLKQKEKLPLVAGHSMGGSLAMQIALYSHDLIEKCYAFNPPVPNERDWHFYKTLPPEIQNKIQVSANLDDFAFWRIGAKIIGQVTLFLGKQRWHYFHVTLVDCLLIIPAFIKFLLNVQNAFPAHQRILRFTPLCLAVKLSEEEIEEENQERTLRRDYLHFWPKLYDPLRVLVHWIRTLFGWKLEQEFLRNEIEIISLHEKDLTDSFTEENRIEIESELKSLQIQKERLQARLKND